jgi:3-phenylpropionate/cinnamic acid dioxygenase small subunit
MDDDDAIAEWRVARVLSRYCRYLDDQRWDDVVALFTEDCVFETMGQRLEGRSHVRSFFPQESTVGDRPLAMHMLSNIVVDLDGDEASAESDWVMLSRDDQGATGIGLAGRYRDRLVRVGEDWLIGQRRVVALARPSPS